MVVLTEDEISMVYLLVDLEYNESVINDETMGYKTPHTERLENLLNKLAE
jgi:hypothetical protein